MEKTWIKLMLSFVCCMSIVGCNGGVSSTSVDENKSTLKYDTNHIEIPGDDQIASDDTWFGTRDYEQFMEKADFTEKSVSYLEYDSSLAWWHDSLKIYWNYCNSFCVKYADTKFSNNGGQPFYFYEYLAICSNKIGFLTSGIELDSPESFDLKAMFVPTEKHYKDIEIRTETTQKYITEKTYYNLFGVDDGDNELLGSIQIIPNKITIDENDIVEYITTHLTSNKDMN